MDARASQRQRSPLFASSAAGAVVAALTTPLDVVKNAWQAERLHSSEPTLGSVFSSIVRNGGVGRLWTGLLPTLALSVPGSAVFFTMYEASRKRGHSEARAGTEARCACVLLFAPLELLKTARQSQAAGSRALWVASPQSLWGAVTPTLMRDVPFSALYWSTNERIVSRLKRSVPSVGEQPVALIASGVSAVIAVVATHPFDVVKTTTQAQLGRGARGVSATGVTRGIFALYGIRGFTVGLLPRLVKTVPACVIFLGAYRGMRGPRGE
eukprot:Polyplicarium_translucidae@DN2756_c0_g1_i1.p1